MSIHPTVVWRRALLKRLLVWNTRAESYLWSTPENLRCSRTRFYNIRTSLYIYTYNIFSVYVACKLSDRMLPGMAHKTGVRASSLCVSESERTRAKMLSRTHIATRAQAKQFTRVVLAFSAFVYERCRRGMSGVEGG